MDHRVSLVATEGMFRGLARQNMLFHQCICELIDNAIAAAPSDKKFRVDVVFLKNEDDQNIVDVLR